MPEKSKELRNFIENQQKIDVNRMTLKQNLKNDNPTLIMTSQINREISQHQPLFSINIATFQFSQPFNPINLIIS